MAQRGDLKWGTVDNLKELIDKYFNACRIKEDIPTITGLSLALDCAPSTIKYYANGEYEERLSKKALEAKEQLLLEAGSEEERSNEIVENGIYCKDLLIESMDGIDAIKADVSSALKIARVKMEEWLNQSGFKAKNPAYFIFYGKNAYGYRDQPQEVSLHQNNLNLNIKIEQIPQKQPTIIVSED